MSQPVPVHVHHDAIAIGIELESGTPWKKLGGERATDRHAGQLARKWHSKLIVVFKLPDGYRYYCGLNRQGTPVAFDIYRPPTNRSQKRRSR
ncbi:MAG: hypothetical protein AAGF93_01475 [Cyanobacteria bacterium P01_H01_bin.105]